MTSYLKKKKYIIIIITHGDLLLGLELLPHHPIPLPLCLLLATPFRAELLLHQAQLGVEPQEERDKCFFPTIFFNNYIQ